VKIPPNNIVKVKDSLDLIKFFVNISWWAQVILTPDDSKRIVFSNGILIGLKEITELGGQNCPSSTVGEILLWKKAQKKDTKNKTSDAMNRTIPVFRPFTTISE
jgi:hypothetical protein